MQTPDEKKSREERFFDEHDRPEFCYCYEQSVGNGILIKRGESGYYPLDYDCPAHVVKTLNKRLGIDHCMVEAMHIGSMMGWDVPGAFPQTWYEEQEAGMDVEAMVYKE